MTKLSALARGHLLSGNGYRHRTWTIAIVALALAATGTIGNASEPLSLTGIQPVTKPSAVVSQQPYQALFDKFHWQCAGDPSNSCFINLPKVKNGNRLELTFISCQVATDTDTQVIQGRVFIYPLNGGPIGTNFVPFQLIGNVPASGANLSIGNLHLALFAEQKEHVRLQIDTSGGLFAEPPTCHLTGTLDTLQ